MATILTIQCKETSPSKVAITLEIVQRPGLIIRRMEMQFPIKLVSEFELYFEALRCLKPLGVEDETHIFHFPF